MIRPEIKAQLLEAAERTAERRPDGPRRLAGVLGQCNRDEQAFYARELGEWVYMAWTISEPADELDVVERAML